MKFITKIFILFFALNSFALTIDQKLDDVVLERQALKIFKNIKCPTCPSQSIADSDTSSATNLRILIREELSKGRSKTEIESHLIEKYGREILLTPPFTYRTYLLWLFPILFLGLMINVFYNNNLDQN